MPVRDVRLGEKADSALRAATGFPGHGLHQG